MMDFVLGLLRDTALYLLQTIQHNGLALVLGVMVAAAMQVYVDPERMRGWLMRRSAISIPATVAFGAFTPFCACGTMAVVLAMVATSLPWGPIMAFLTSSPLMGPEEFVLMSGVVGLNFAIALTVASILIGLGSGYAAHVIEKKTGFLKGQLRFGSAQSPEPAPAACGCSPAPAAAAPVQAPSAACCDAAEDEPCGCGAAPVASSGCGCSELALEPPTPPRPAGAFLRKYKIDKMLRAAFDVGVKRILPYFLLFAAIGYLINRFIPTEWVTALFGRQNVFAVPLAAVLGLPLYVNGDSSVPLIQSLMASGVTPGAMLAFMITGPGTSAGVLAGLATIMKRRAIMLYAGSLLVGAMLLGYAYDIILALIGH